MSAPGKPRRPRPIKRSRIHTLPPEGIHDHSSSIDDFIPQVDEPLYHTVEHTSQDNRRVYHTQTLVDAPSPIKRKHMDDLAEAETATQVPIDANTVNNADDTWFDDEAYEMFGDNALPPPNARKRNKKKGRGLLEPSLQEFRPLRQEFLNQMLRRDGCGDASSDICPGCGGPDSMIRCRNCFGDLLYCDVCTVKNHEHHPLHIIERWQGGCFVEMSLKSLGLCIQFGHHGCVQPRAAAEDFVVLSLNGIHSVNVDFCGCPQEFIRGSPRVQLLRAGWFPSTLEKPQTAATFDCLDFFHMQTLQGKTTMYDFYVALEKLTDNTGVKPANRYSEFLRMTREYRHLLMLKRAGRGHDPSGVSGTQPGECAVLCPACPRPGVNIPDDWQKAPPEKRFLYVFFLALDACFRLKHRMISSHLRDPGLGTGWAYFTESEPFRKFLLTVTDQKEMSTCSGLAALDFANTKFSRGYSSTGVAMGVCARHEFIQPTGVGDLQKGERCTSLLLIPAFTKLKGDRFVNMDYVFASILCHIDTRLLKVVSYDILCQWWKKLKERLLKLPPLLRLRISLALMRFVIPKMHIHAHMVACQVLFSLNFLLGAGQTDGEGIERPWANIGGVATSTREQGPGFRADTLDDHWGFWNWIKLTLLRTLSYSSIASLLLTVMRLDSRGFTEELKLPRVSEAARGR
ncbi:hypothetical protein C8R43DRAFT_1143595 [Mycena crocata]|nr:hypothetical protein C8R43DRAFT_1143595 [Mycena crocata]